MTDWTSALSTAYTIYRRVGGVGGYGGAGAEKYNDASAVADTTSARADKCPVVSVVSPETADTSDTIGPNEVVPLSGYGKAHRPQRSGQRDTTDTIDTTGLDILFDERAAIVEHDGGVPREWAEGFARLDVSEPLPGFSPGRWRQLLDDGGRFLDRWAFTAVELGWSAEDVFGIAMVARKVVDVRGLVSLISGGQVIDIKADRATILTQSGSRITYLRLPHPDTVVIWRVAAD